MPAPGLVLPVPGPGPGVCRQCHGPAAGAQCFCCSILLARLGSLAAVVPVGVCPVPGPFHRVLRGYKDAPAARQRQQHAGRLAAILAGFAAAHGACLDRGWSPVCTVLVPPAPRRGSPWPMDPVAQAGVAAGLPPLVPALEWSAPGEARTGHLTASGSAFTVAADHRPALRGHGVVLLDDSYTTGATAQSAALALRRAGAGAVVVLVLARIVRPGRTAIQRAYWELVRAAHHGRRAPDGCRGPCAVGGCPWAGP